MMLLTSALCTLFVLYSPVNSVCLVQVDMSALKGENGSTDVKASCFQSGPKTLSLQIPVLQNPYASLIYKASSVQPKLHREILFRKTKR